VSRPVVPYATTLTPPPRARRSIFTRSLRWRLIITTATATALILGLCGIVLDASIRRSLTGEFDSSLERNARAILPLIYQRGSKIVAPELAEMREFKRPARPEYFEIRDLNTKKDTLSPSLGDTSLGLPSTRFEVEITPLNLPDGRPGRAVSIRFKPDFRIDESEDTPPEQQKQHVFVFIMARDTLELLNTLNRTRWLLLLVFSGATICSAALMAIIIQRGLRSTGKLAARIARIDDSTLGQRLEMDGAPTELMPVVQRLNDLLQRLQDTLEREKAFSSDVAHELRTPLSGLETALEVSASQRRSPEEYERVITRCLDVSRRMHVMVDNLLMLARAESKQLVVQREPMDLAELCREAWSNFEQRAEERKLGVEWRVPPDCVVNSDQEKIRLLLHNFFDNAVSYTDPGGRITISIDRKPKARLQVSNTGSRLSAEDATHVFERFWRGDRARTAGSHCGLGLTLCRNIAVVLGAAIIAKSEGGLFTVALELPGPAKETVPAPLVPSPSGRGLG
jgi:two-component system heavy metal sensor histidine kinase CusS